MYRLGSVWQCYAGAHEQLCRPGTRLRQPATLIGEVGLAVLLDVPASHAVCLRRRGDPLGHRTLKRQVAAEGGGTGG